MSRIASPARSFRRPCPAWYTSDRARSTTARSPGSAKRRPRNVRLAADPLRHRRLRDEERVGDLASAQPSNRPQRQGHLRCGRGLGVAAPEQQQQRVVTLFGDARNGRKGGRLLATPSRRLAAAGIDEPSRRNRREPPALVAADGRARPGAPRPSRPVRRPRPRRSPPGVEPTRPAPGGQGIGRRERRRPTAPRLA